MMALIFYILNKITLLFCYSSEVETFSRLLKRHAFSSDFHLNFPEGNGRMVMYLKPCLIETVLTNLPQFSVFSPVFLSYCFFYTFFLKYIKRRKKITLHISDGDQNCSFLCVFFLHFILTLWYRYNVKYTVCLSY